MTTVVCTSGKITRKGNYILLVRDSGAEIALDRIKDRHLISFIKNNIMPENSEDSKEIETPNFRLIITGERIIKVKSFLINNNLSPINWLKITERQAERVKELLS